MEKFASMSFGNGHQEINQKELPSLKNNKPPIEALSLPLISGFLVSKNTGLQLIPVVGGIVSVATGLVNGHSIFLRLRLQIASYFRKNPHE